LASGNPNFSGVLGPDCALTRGRSALRKLLAVVVLAVAAWLLLKLALNVVAAVAWAVAGFS
jgi:hypothetical protein